MSRDYIGINSGQETKGKSLLRQETARLIPREKSFETPTGQEPIKQNRNSGQLFCPSWGSSALCSEDMYHQPKSQRT